MFVKKLISKLEKNEYVRIIALASLVLGAFITIGSFISNSYKYFSDNLFVANKIADQIENLFAGQDIEYFKKYLGTQILQREVSPKFKEYIFNYKGAFVQSLVDNKDETVVYWAITYCGNTPVVLKRPVFSMPGRYKGEDSKGNRMVENIISPRLDLNKSSFVDFLKEETGELKVFISAATANSFAYESVYFGNPSAYQTIIVGVNDICASSQELYKHQDADNFHKESDDKSPQESISRFRREVKINTYAETAPSFGNEIINLLDSIHSEDSEQPFLNFGVDRIRVRYFSD